MFNRKRRSEGVKLVSYLQLNERGSESHLVNPKVYKATFSLVDVSVNAKKYY